MGESIKRGSESRRCLLDYAENCFTTMISTMQRRLTPYFYFRKNSRLRTNFARAADDIKQSKKGTRTAISLTETLMLYSVLCLYIVSLFVQVCSTERLSIVVKRPCLLVVGPLRWSFNSWSVPGKFRVYFNV